MNEATDMLTIGLRVPTIHLNGTSRAELLEQICDASHAIILAMDALSNAAPNGRDYYPQGDDAAYEATRQHRTRMARLQATRAELMIIAEAISV